MNAPPWGRCSALSGMHEGTVSSVPPGASQGVTLSLLQPHPGPGVTPGAGTGLSPANLSCEAIAAYRCPPQDGESAMENVLSEMANSVARFVMLGIWLGAYPPMHAYGGVVVAAQPPALMFCQPSINGTPPTMCMAASWLATE